MSPGVGLGSVRVRPRVRLGGAGSLVTGPPVGLRRKAKPLGYRELRRDTPLNAVGYGPPQYLLA